MNISQTRYPFLRVTPARCLRKRSPKNFLSGQRNTDERLYSARMRPSKDSPSPATTFPYSSGHTSQLQKTRISFPLRWCSNDPQPRTSRGFFIAPEVEWEYEREGSAVAR